MNLYDPPGTPVRVQLPSGRVLFTETTSGVIQAATGGEYVALKGVKAVQPTTRCRVVENG
jgi:hypothetical protein